MRRALGLFALLAPLTAWAYPPHGVVEVKPGATTFTRLYDVSAIAVADPSIATVEQLPSDELLVSGKKAGTTEIAALCSGKIVGIRVHVRALGAPPAGDGQKELDAALKACPVHQVVDDELGASASSPACRAALLALFATDRFVVKQIAITFDEVSLQAQIAEIEQAVKQAGITGVQLHYQGATLVLKGSLSPSEAGRLAVAVYTHALGSVPIDADELEITLPDGGAQGDPPPITPTSLKPVR